ncbi:MULTISPECIES: Zn-ribbon domain-containing OB-fold protein [Rhodococcus]|uniref:Zn-ribbon domain-containing OB-fold protein n=1 Tax=Rhodococcus TaxID=1827 RepID=UPI0007C749CE|nr:MULTISPECIES: OB-fold domain-containing protein [Rhodococcus]SCC64340.1 hypothetical protein GA0061093_117123 [Rhodococcus qingshengii]
MTHSSSARPLALRDERSAEYFDSLARGVLQVRRCRSCEHLSPPAAQSCSRCHGDSLAWTATAGRGHVVVTVVDRTVAGEPQVVGFIELDEGPWIAARILGADGAVPAGAAVTMVITAPAGSQGEPVPAFTIDASGPSA